MGIVKAVFRISKKFTIERDLLNSKMQCSGKKTSDVSSRFFFFFFWCVYTYIRASLVVLVHKGCEFDPWVGKISWRRPWQPTPVFLPGKSYGRRKLAGYSPWGHKESDMTE